MYGLPVVVENAVAVGDFRGYRIYAMPGGSRTSAADILLVPLAPGCEFQPYSYLSDPGGT
jgi:hypothetical protein